MKQLCSTPRYPSRCPAVGQLLVVSDDAVTLVSRQERRHA